MKLDREGCDYGTDPWQPKRLLESAKRHGVWQPCVDRGMSVQADVSVVTTGVHDSDLDRMFALSEQWERLGEIDRSFFAAMQ